MLTPDQWQQVTNIALYTWKGGGDIWSMLSGIEQQMGVDTVYNYTQEQWEYVRNLVANDWDAQYSASEISARVQDAVSAWVGGVEEPVGGELTSEQRSAKANLDNFLSNYGLQSLGDYVWQEYLNNIPVEQIMLDIRGRPEYKARFPYLEAIAKKGHAMSEAEAVAYEKQVQGFARAVGMPEEMFDQPGDFTPLIENELSVQEVAQRIQDWVNFADSAPAANKLELNRLYGVGLGGIAAYFMDPDKALPLLEKQANAALTSVSSINSGYGELAQSEAEYVGGLGFQPGQTREGFGNLVKQAELFNPLEGGEATIDRQQQLAAMFGGNAAAQTAIEKQASRRGAYFQQGGGFSANKEGIAGVGESR